MLGFLRNNWPNMRRGRGCNALCTFVLLSCGLLNAPFLLQVCDRCGEAEMHQGCGYNAFESVLKKIGRMKGVSQVVSMRGGEGVLDKLLKQQKYKGLPCFAARLEGARHCAGRIADSRRHSRLRCVAAPAPSSSAAAQQPAPPPTPPARPPAAQRRAPTRPALSVINRHSSKPFVPFWKPQYDPAADPDAVQPEAAPAAAASQRAAPPIGADYSDGGPRRRRPNKRALAAAAGGEGSVASGSGAAAGGETDDSVASGVGSPEPGAGMAGFRAAGACGGDTGWHEDWPGGLSEAGSGSGGSEDVASRACWSPATPGGGGTGDGAWGGAAAAAAAAPGGSAGAGGRSERSGTVAAEEADWDEEELQRAMAESLLLSEADCWDEEELQCAMAEKSLLAAADHDEGSSSSGGGGSDGGRGLLSASWGERQQLFAAAMAATAMAPGSGGGGGGPGEAQAAALGAQQQLVALSAAAPPPPGAVLEPPSCEEPPPPTTLVEEGALGNAGTSGFPHTLTSARSKPGVVVVDDEPPLTSGLGAPAPTSGFCAHPAASPGAAAGAAAAQGSGGARLAGGGGCGGGSGPGGAGGREEAVATALGKSAVDEEILLESALADGDDDEIMRLLLVA